MIHDQSVGNIKAVTGSVTAQTIGYVPFELTPGTRSYFEVSVPARAATYSIAIFQWEWMQRGGGDNRR